MFSFDLTQLSRTVSPEEVPPARLALARRPRSSLASFSPTPPAPTSQAPRQRPQGLQPPGSDRGAQCRRPETSAEEAAAAAGATLIATPGRRARRSHQLEAGGEAAAPWTPRGPEWLLASKGDVHQGQCMEQIWRNGRQAGRQKKDHEGKEKVRGECRGRSAEQGQQGAGWPRGQRRVRSRSGISLGTTYIALAAKSL